MDSKTRVIPVRDADTAERVARVDRVERLVAEGHSRLTAQRIVEIEKGRAEAGRARRHPTSRQ